MHYNTKCEHVVIDCVGHHPTSGTANVVPACAEHRPGSTAFGLVSCPREDVN